MSMEKLNWARCWGVVWLVNWTKASMIWLTFWLKTVWFGSARAFWMAASAESATARTRCR